MYLLDKSSKTHYTSLFMMTWARP